MKSRLTVLSKNKRVMEQLLYLLLGMFIAFSLSNLTPLQPYGVLIGLIALVGLIVNLLVSGQFLELRIMLLGASIMSVTLAVRTFFSLNLNGEIQIQLDALVGLFRSILLASFFSLFERLTKFLEEQLEKKSEET